MTAEQISRAGQALMRVLTVVLIVALAHGEQQTAMLLGAIFIMASDVIGALLALGVAAIYVLRRDR